MLSPENSLVFYSIIVLMLIGGFLILLFVVFNQRKNKLIQQQLEAELKNQQKLHALELESLRSQLNPHFVHNSLNAIQYYIQRHEVEVSENYLTKFSKLMRQFFEYSKHPSISIADEIALLQNYLAIEKMRFEEKISYAFEIDEALDTEHTQIPTMLLQPILENAINHGLFHKKEKGTVKVNFKSLDNQTYQITITDDGVGINKTKQMRKVGGKQRSSSKLMQGRLKLLEQTTNFHIDYSVTDLSEVSPQQGTQVKLIITH